MSWHQVPDRPVPLASPPRWLAWALGTLPLLIGLAPSGGDGPWLRDWVLPVVAVHLVIALVGRVRPRWFLAAAAAGVPVVAAWIGGAAGVLIALVAVSGLTLWSLGLDVVGSQPARVRPATLLRPALVAAAAADVALVFAPGIKFGAGLMALAGGLALAAVAFPTSALQIAAHLDPSAARVRQVGRRVDAAVGRGARAIGVGLASLAMVPVAVVVSVIWVVHRIARHDPLRAPTGEDSQWAQRLGTDPYPVRNYSGMRIVDRSSWSQRLSRIAVTALALVLILGVTVAVYRRDTSSPGRSPSTGDVAGRSASGDPRRTDPAACPEPPADPVLSGQPGHRILSCEQNAVFAHAESRASTGFRFQDFAGQTVNLADGVRRTWRPPACSCRRLKVWWLGGSAAWGEGQRDEFTLPSMLAKAAWKQGIALDIENQAMPTYTFNQEVHRLAELTTTEGPPDLILSYGGGNDLAFQALRASRGHADDSSDIALLEQTFDDVLRNGVPVDPTKIRWTPNPQEVDADISEAMASTVAQATATRFRRNLGLADRLAASIDRPIGVVWQPLLAGSSPAAGPAGAVPPGLLKGFTAMDREARSALPSSVIDMGSTFEGATEPMFFDLFHTGERGAAIVADRLLARLGPLIADAQRQAERRPPR